MYMSTVLSKAKLFSKVAALICNKTSSCYAINEGVPCSISFPITGVV